MAMRKTGNPLALVGIALALVIIFRELREAGDSSRLATRVEAAVASSGVRVNHKRITPYLTTYAVRLARDSRARAPVEAYRRN